MVPLQTKTAFSLLQSPMMPPNQLVASAKARVHRGCNYGQQCLIRHG